MTTGGVLSIGAAALDYLRTHQLGRLATLDRDGSPQVKPVGYTVNAETGTIDIAGFNLAASAKYRNILARPAVSFVVDDVVAEGAAGTRFVELRGRAEPAEAVQPPGSPLGPELIRIRPRRVITWNVDPDRPGLHTQDLATS
jgi:pyridoxamine 5'-phosphate oxidase family protein